MCIRDSLYPSRIIVGVDMENEELKKSAELYENRLEIAKGKMTQLFRSVFGKTANCVK